MRFQRMDQLEQRHWGRGVSGGSGSSREEGVGGNRSTMDGVVSLYGDFGFCSEQSKSHRGLMESSEQKQRTSPSTTRPGN